MRGWVKLDDGFLDHPKFVNLSLAEVGLWAAGLAYANRYRTDGLLPDGWVRRVGGSKQAKALVSAGLWREYDTGWEIHDYLEYQRSAEQIEELSTKRAASGRQGGTKRAANAKQVAKQTAGKSSSKSQPEEEREEERDTEPSVPVASTPSKPRARDPWFDALIEACHYNPGEITSSMGSRIGVAKAQLVKLGATPDEIIRRAENARRQGDRKSVV